MRDGVFKWMELLTQPSTAIRNFGSSHIIPDPKQREDELFKRSD